MFHCLHTIFEDYFSFHKLWPAFIVISFEIMTKWSYCYAYVLIMSINRQHFTSNRKIKGLQQKNTQAYNRTPLFWFFNTFFSLKKTTHFSHFAKSVPPSHSIWWIISSQRKKPIHFMWKFSIKINYLTAKETL